MTSSDGSRRDSRQRELIPPSRLAKAHALGISGVPAFVFDGRIGFSGAQPYEVFVRALQTVQAGR